VHVWILRRDGRFVLSDQAYPAGAAGQDISAWHRTVAIPGGVKEFVAGGGGVWIGKTVKEGRGGGAGAVREIEVDLRIGEYQVSGTLVVRPAGGPGRRVPKRRKAGDRGADSE